MVKYSKGGYWQPTIPGQTCQHCGRVFVAHSKGQRFCGNECKSASRSTKCTRLCANCGSEFEVAAKSPRVVCSKACQYELIKKRSREKRQRTCVICGSDFAVRSSDRVGKTCSKPCQLAYMAELRKGTRHSAETKAKMSQAHRAAWADPERREVRLEAHAAGVAAWHADEANAAAFSKRMSERMKLRHADPEWQKVRDKRSSETMKANWERYRDDYISAATERYWREREQGVGLNSPEAMAKRDERAKWVMKMAQKALHAETDVDAKMSELQYRLRKEMPYDGPAEDSDYFEYLQKLCRAIVTHPEYRAIVDTFMSEALPRFSEEWNRRMAEAA